MISKCEPGSIDDCMPSVSALLIDDIFGEVSEEKEVGDLGICYYFSVLDRIVMELMT